MFTIWSVYRGDPVSKAFNVRGMLPGARKAARAKHEGQMANWRASAPRAPGEAPSFESMGSRQSQTSKDVGWGMTLRNARSPERRTTPGAQLHVRRQVRTGPKLRDRSVPNPIQLDRNIRYTNLNERF
jgi:hypothetical protein